MAKRDFQHIIDEIHAEDGWRQKYGKYFQNILLSLLSAAITFPVFIIVYRYIPDLVLQIGQGIRIDHILTFLVIFLVIRYFIGSFRYIFLFLSLVVLGIFGINEIRGGYGYRAVFDDYLDMVSYMESNPVKIPFLKESHMTIRNAAEIREAIDYDNAELREFAVKSSLTYFNQRSLYYKYGNLVRYFSVFKTINRWNYVPDPKGEDFYMPASSSCKVLGGDCDDHSILMAATIKAIGGEVRIVHTDRHLYPEVKVGRESDLDVVVYLIKRELFYKEALGRKIYYHVDEDGDVWLNFDYTGRYPGARFMADEIIGILEI